MVNWKTLKPKALVPFVEYDNVVNYRGMRRQNLPYVVMWVVYYAWVIIFSTWWTASSLTENVFDTKLRGILHIINLLSSALFVLLMKKEHYLYYVRVGAVLIVAGMGLFLTAQNSYMQLFSTSLIGILLGCVNAGILMPFVFALNNSEKFYAVVGSYGLINLLLLFQDSYAAGHGPHNVLFPFIMLLAALGTTLLFQKDSAASGTDEAVFRDTVMPSRIYLTLFFNCAIAVLCKGAGKGILNISLISSDLPLLIWYDIGGIAGCLIYIAVYAFAAKAFVWLGNITFASVAMGLLCNAFTPQIPGLAAPFALLLGIGNTVGMINMYYIIGVVGKKYNSMRYLRLSIIFIGICGGISGLLLGNLITDINTFEISIMASLISAAVMLMFLMVSPVMAQARYEKDWGKDSANVEIDHEQRHVFEKYQLSKRETEVCELLLKGYTLRQISAILEIAYSTVNTYCTSLYRKLGINSRTELLLLHKDYLDN